MDAATHANIEGLKRAFFDLEAGIGKTTDTHMSNAGMVEKWNFLVLA